MEREPVWGSLGVGDVRDIAGEPPTNPGLATVLRKDPTGDREHPGRQLLRSLDGVDASQHHDEHFLRGLIGIDARSAEPTTPLKDGGEPVLAERIDGRRVATLDRFPLSRGEGGVTGPGSCGGLDVGV